MAQVKQSEFARLLGVSRKTVTSWKAKNYLVFVGELVDVEASKKQLKKYRVGGLPAVTQNEANESPGNRKKSAPGNSAGNKTGNKTPAVRAPRNKPAPDPGTLEFEAQEFVSSGAANLDLNEAKRVKENYLAKLRQLEYEEKAGSIVDLALVEKVLFEGSRAQRDAWLNWPAKVGPLIAATLNVEADQVVEILNEHVHKHISQLGEPEISLG